MKTQATASQPTLPAQTPHRPARFQVSRRRNPPPTGQRPTSKAKPTHRHKQNAGAPFSTPPIHNGRLLARRQQARTPPNRYAKRSMTMRIAIAGADGRMGRMLIEAVLQSPDMALTVALDRAGSPALGQDAGSFLGQETGVAITDDLGAIANADCLIDFTRPEGTLAHLQACVEHGTRCVIGTTGFTEEGRRAIQAASQKIAVVFAPNMSVGVNATLKLLDIAARLLNSGYDVEVFEAHHRNKVDAPSGTALAMGEAVAHAWGKNLRSEEH